MTGKLSLQQDKEYAMALGENLRRLRNDKGLTQAELASKAGTRMATVSQLERNEGDPKLSTLYKIMDALECSADALLIDLKHIGLSMTFKSMLERAEKLPEEDQKTIIDIIDTYCIVNGMNEFVSQPGWRKFGIVDKASSHKGRKVVDETESKTP